MKKDSKGFYQTIAWWLPKKLIYYCIIRAWAHATIGKYSKQEVPALLAEEMLRRWGAENK